MASKRQIFVGNVPIGGGAPVAVQTMTKTETANLAALAAREEIRDAVQAGVDQANDRLARVEQIKKFTILEGDWAPGGEELTPTMKLKRRPIAEKYASEIEAMYSR